MNPNINNPDYTTQPFKVPENYFFHLEGTILSKTIGEEKGENPFTTPDSYFEKLEDSIISKTIQIEKSSKRKIIPLFIGKFYWISTAACVIFAVLLGVYFINNHREQENQKTFANFANNAKEKINSVQDRIYATPEDKPVVLQKETSVAYTSHPGKSSEIKLQYSKATVSQKGKSSPLAEKSAEVIYDLYFDSENHTTLADEEILEEEFFLL
jgi:hypothetical protein